MIVFHGPAGSHRQLGPTPWTKGSGEFKLTSLIVCFLNKPAAIMKGVVADHNYLSLMIRLPESDEDLLREVETSNQPSFGSFL